MIIALDSSGNRISPFPRGMGFCQVCEDPLIAHCGEIKVWHWQHRHDRECDPWKEHETLWHRQWKERFPLPWCEVILQNDDGEKHVADVKTQGQVVIEFQNSPISTHTIQEREDFYQDMVWVINAAEFKKNIRMASIVKSELREIDKESFNQIALVKANIETEIRDLEEKVDQLKITSRSKIQSIGNHQDELKELMDLQTDLPALTQQIHDYWIKDSWLKSLVSLLAADVEVNFKKQLIEYATARIHHQKEITKQEEIIQYINNKENIEFEERALKVIHYYDLDRSNFHKAVVIEKKSMDSLFLQGVQIKNELEFQNLAYRLNDVIIAIDPSSALQTLNDRIQLSQTKIDSINQRVAELQPLLQQALSESLSIRITEKTDKITKLDNESDTMIQQRDQLQQDLYKLTEGKETRIQEGEAEVKREQSSDRFTTMRAYKNMYRFTWKHERQTWQYATMPIYFDMGNGFLFHKVDKRTLRKYTYEEFVNEYGGKALRALMTKSAVAI